MERRALQIKLKDVHDRESKLDAERKRLTALTKELSEKVEPADESRVGDCVTEVQIAEEEAKQWAPMKDEVRARRNFDRVRVFHAEMAASRFIRR